MYWNVAAVTDALHFLCLLNVGPYFPAVCNLSSICMYILCVSNAVVASKSNKPLFFYPRKNEGRKKLR